MGRWGELFIGAGEKLGRTFLVAERAKELLEEAGFVDIVEHSVKVPIGSWPADPKLREIGRWNLLFLTTGLESMGMYLLMNVLGVRVISFACSLLKLNDTLTEIVGIY